MNGVLDADPKCVYNLYLYEIETTYLDIYVTTLRSRQNCLLQHHETSVSW
jgi:hypothetical protein